MRSSDTQAAQDLLKAARKKICEDALEALGKQPIEYVNIQYMPKYPPIKFGDAFLSGD